MYASTASYSSEAGGAIALIPAFNVDAGGYLQSLTPRGGRTVTLTYSTSVTSPSVAPFPGLLLVVSDPFGHQLNFTYNSQGQIATYTYDGSGLAVSAQNAGGVNSARGPIFTHRKRLRREN